MADEPTTVDVTAPVNMDEVRDRAEAEQLAQMQAQAEAQGRRQARDNAHAERLRTFGDKRMSKAALHGLDTVAGPTGPTSSLFEGSAVPTEEEATGAEAG
jgi:hypothetical protein